MLPYIAVWLATAVAAYYPFRWICKKFAIWTNGDAIIFASLCLIFGPAAMLIALVWAGFLTIERWWIAIRKRPSNWLSRPSKW